MAYIFEHEHKEKPYLKIFEDISAIPRGSYNEKAVSDYILNFAKERDLWCIQDEALNVFIKKPATAGYEDHDPIILQGHMDMVCEKNPGSEHDFKKDPLELYVENGWLKAKETTLGADDGVAVAYILAILDDDTLEHPPLECVINTGEEAGVLGSLAFDTSLLTGKKLIGLDGCTEGTSTILTSGVIGGSFYKRISWENGVEDLFRIKVEGLNAGHAAGNIGKEQANAIKSIGRILYYLDQSHDIRIVDIKGGSYRNAIAEECEVIFSASKSDFESIKKIYDLYSGLEIREHKVSDPGIKFSFEMTSGYKKAISREISKDIIAFLYFMPSGTYMRSIVYDLLPIASRNIGTIGILNHNEEECVEVTYLFRCVDSIELEDMCNKGTKMASSLGFDFELQSKYSGYEIEPGSDFYKIYADVYKEMSGKELEYETVHYGTDVGTYAERIPGLDIIVISPQIIDVHRPTEKLNLASFDRAYQYLKGVLKRS